MDKLKELVLSLPLDPGVYIMKDGKGNIIYIGKAKYLKKRVSSYFNKKTNADPKVLKMVTKVQDIDYIVTNNELEALILESNLIKVHKPLYNILLKDDKGFKFIKISFPPYSRISVVYKKTDDQSIYIGPYSSSLPAQEAVEVASKVFKIPSCSKVLSDIRRYNRPCLNYYINLCNAPCCHNISVEEYQRDIDNVVKYLKSGMKSTIRELKIKMKNLSNELKFEDAAKIRDQIRALEKINSSQNVTICGNKPNFDALGIESDNNNICATLLIFRDFKLIDKKQYLFNKEENLSEVRKTIIVQYYKNNLEKPPVIYLDDYPEDFELIKDFIFKDMSITIPKKGASSKIIEMAKNNSKEKLAQKIRLENKNIININKLQELLLLDKLPKRIEAYDISNFGSQTMVGGMILFENGRPKKSGYRKFKIKDTYVQDDYKCMQEIINRRILKYKNPDQSDNSFNKLPDLIFIDGGYSHVVVVKEIFKKYNIDIPIYGMVKNINHKTDMLIDYENNKIDIKKDSDIFLLITRIQEEVHRFTITYSRKSHNKSLIKSQLYDIPVVGKSRWKILMNEFKTIENIRSASLEELKNAKGIPANVAKSIFDYFALSKNKI